MKCPRCKAIKLNTKVLERVEIDECPSCKGIWFDQDELRQTKDNFDSDLNWMDFDIWKNRDKFKTTEHPAPCPRCEKSMLAIDYAHSGVEIDYCQHCKGVWLDGGEFGKILHNLEQELTTMSSGQYFKATLKEAADLITMKEGFISEWKDFTNVLRLMKYRVFIENPALQKSVDAAKEIPVK
mgnify:CR=1 FL=1